MRALKVDRISLLFIGLALLGAALALAVLGIGFAIPVTTAAPSGGSTAASNGNVKFFAMADMNITGEVQAGPTVTSTPTPASTPTPPPTSTAVLATVTPYVPPLSPPNTQSTAQAQATATAVITSSVATQTAEWQVKLPGSG